MGFITEPRWYSDNKHTIIYSGKTLVLVTKTFSTHVERLKLLNRI